MNARDLHFDAIVVDCHVDTIQRAVDGGEDLAARTERGHVDLPRLKQGGVDAQFFACFAAPKYIEGDRCVKRAIRLIDAVKGLALRKPEEVAIAYTAADVRRIAAEKRIAAVICLEGGHTIEDDLAVLRQFFAFGARYMTLTWNNTNNWADACGGPMRHGGLTGFGREVVREMNRIGMMVDLSHAAEKTFWDAIGTSTRPVLCSHSNARMLCAHRRNLADDQLRAVAKNGGVVCVVYYSGFVSEAYRKAGEEHRKEWEERMRTAQERHAGDTETLDRVLEEMRAQAREIESERPRPDMEELIRHVDHIAEVAGVDHVGLGSDYDGCSNVPVGLEDCSRTPAVTRALVKRGYSEPDIRKILGENILRVMDASVDQVVSASGSA